MTRARLFRPRPLRRALFTLGLVGLCLPALSCSSGGAEPFILRLIADDGSVPSGPRNAIILNAVGRVQVVIAPDRSSGNHFDALAPRLFDGGDVETRVSAAGEWVITLERPYVEAHAFDHGTTFALEIPLAIQNTTDDPAIHNPLMRVTFQRMGEIIASTERNVNWPLLPGDALDVVVFCPDATRFQCLNTPPP